MNSINLFVNGYKDFNVFNEIEDLFMFVRNYTGLKIELIKHNLINPLFVINTNQGYNSSFDNIQDARNDILKIMRLDILNNKGVIDGDI